MGYHAAVLLVALAPSPTVAQTAEHGAESERAQDGDIVVTAQRREQRLQDVPVSVTVVSGESLAQRNIVTLSDMSAQTPSVRIASGPASDQLHIRGIGSGFNAGFEQSVATFVGGVYRNRSRSQLAANEDVVAPRLQWVMARARDTAGLAVPAGRYGVENPDNVYRLMPLDPARRYRLIGRLAKTPPTAFTFSVMTAQFMDTLKVKTDGILTSRQLKVEDDGGFVVTLGPDAMPGEVNHIRMSPVARILFLSETMGAKPEARLVKLAQLADALPTGTRLVTPDERRVQLARRLASGDRRVALLAYSDQPDLLPAQWPMA